MTTPNGPLLTTLTGTWLNEPDSDEQYFSACAAFDDGAVRYLSIAKPVTVQALVDGLRVWAANLEEYAGSMRATAKDEREACARLADLVAATTMLDDAKRAATHIAQLIRGQQIVRER